LWKRWRAAAIAIEISAAELGQHIASENEKLEDTVT